MKLAARLLVGDLDLMVDLEYVCEGCRMSALDEKG